MGVVLVTVLLLAANAFFVGAEFAAMSARRSQLEPLADAGSKGAKVALDALQHTGILLATSQLGITVCSVLLGAVSEAALHHAFVPVVEHLGLSTVVADVVALVLALTIVVFLHVVYGEMIPKNISIAKPERAAVVLVPSLVMVSRVVAPVIRVMDWLAKAVVRLFGVEPKDEVSSAFTAEEVAHILEESREEGLVEERQHERLGAALEFSDKDAGDVGVALSALVTVTTEATPDDIERLVAKHGYSRYPVVDGSGEPAGYLHLKDVLYADDAERREPVPAKRVRRLATVRRDDEVEAVLATMQSSGSHLARVVADDGVVVGVVFLEDVIEELVGEVSDAQQR
jgi:CBS domain containing-hemolysin-like protein